MPTTASESGAGGVYTWHKVSNKKAKGGSYYVEHRKTAKASWTFKGKAVTWLTEAGPSFGKADVYVDGHRKGTVNNYAKSAKYGVGRTFKGFSKGTHTIEIRVLGKKGAKAGKGSSVSIDGFKVGKKVTASPALSNVAWQRAKSGAAQGGAYAVADLKGQTVKVPFRGTAVTLQLPKGSTNGKASVYLDGKLKKTLDLYSKHAAWGNKFTLKGLTNAKHTVMVKVLGKKNHKASNTAVILDGISVK
jgi:hypothetical protein